MGFHPMHFNGMNFKTAGGTIIAPVVGNCASVMPQYNWQANDQMSREELAHAIAIAESEIEEHVGYPLAPRWVETEQHQYPHLYRHAAEYEPGADAEGWYRGVRTPISQLISGGVRASTLLDDDAAVTYSDPDGDGFPELATISIPAATEPNHGEVHLFFAGHDDEEGWEIRPLKSVSWAAGTLTVTLDTWLLVNPALWERFNTDAEDPSFRIQTLEDTSDADEFVQEVAAYRIYNDTTAVSATFIWNHTVETQSGVFVVDEVDGFGRPIPATYDSADARWETDPWTVCNDIPDRVRVSYYAGDRDSRFIAERSLDPLSNFWAETITMLATARMPRPVCTCGAAKAKYEDWRIDVTLTTPEGKTYNRPVEMVDNPFGPHKGEMQAWQRILKTSKRRARSAVI